MKPLHMSQYDQLKARRDHTERHPEPLSQATLIDLDLAGYRAVAKKDTHRLYFEVDTETMADPERRDIYLRSLMASAIANRLKEILKIKLIKADADRMIATYRTELEIITP